VAFVSVETLDPGLGAGRARAAPGQNPFGDGGRYSPEDEPLNIRELLLPFWRRKWIIILTALVTTVLGVLLAVNSEPQYTANARVIFDPERLKIIDLDNVTITPDTSTTGLQNQIEILRSAVLMERVADILRLQDTPEFNEDLRSGPSPLMERAVDFATRVADRLNLPLSVREMLSALGVINTPEVDLEPAEESERRRQGIVKRLIDEIQLRPIPNSRVIDIGYASTNAGLASSIVNAVAEQYILVQIEKKRDDVAAATELLSVRVQDLENRLNASEEALEIARLELARSVGHSAQMTGQRLEELTTVLEAAREATRDAELRLARASEGLVDAERLAIVPEFRVSEIIGSYRVQEREIIDELAAQSAIFGAGSPILTRLEARLDLVQENIRAEAELITAALTQEVEAAKAREASVEASLRDLEARALDQSKAEMRLQRLEREALASRSIYDSFVSRLKETSEQAGLQTPDARFLTRALIPQTSDILRRLITIAMSGLAGLAVGAGIVFLLEQLNNSFRKSGDVEERTGLSLLASIPNAGKRRRPSDLISDFSKDLDPGLSEAVRNLRTSITYSNIDQPPKVVMITSSAPSEGKTTTAALFGITSERMGRSAIIVDCDFRRRSIGAIYPGKAGAPGLLAVLEGTVAVADAVISDPETGIHVLKSESAGHLQGNPADILASKRFRKLIEELRIRYDTVILDTPPVLVVTDARIIAPLADAVVYMIKWNATSQSAVVEGLRILRSVNAKIAGIAFSFVNPKHAEHYVSSDYYRTSDYRKTVSA
jgi:capsular exopolysaccharide synthesis family protein